MNLVFFLALNWPQTLPEYLSLIGVLVVISVLGYFVYRISRKTSLSVFSVVIGLFIFTSYLFLDWQLMTIILIIFYLTFLHLVTLSNIPLARNFINNLFKLKKLKPKKGSEISSTVSDETAIYQSLTDAVTYLSKTKTGAIIVIERKMNLSEYIKNGTTLNAPFSSELLMTIFYPGTRLHDGAVIIKNRKIVAASVYFTPSTKPLLGKYGSRHRAALGISEQTDALTIVVSEETGRISFAYGGELEPVFIDNFKNQLINHLQLTTSSNEGGE